jgi:DMSO reductase family type II enzyme chaperone
MGDNRVGLMGRQARTRGQLYAALAQAFRKPEAVAEEDGEDSLAQVLKRAALAVDAQALGPIAEELIGSLEIPEDQAEQALRTLEIEYNRLFVGPGRPQAPPYESVYRDSRGLVMGPAAREVERRYAEAGLALAPDHHDLPDHVATELGFMACLAMQEAEAQGEDALAWLDRERTFLRDHLTVWLPRFCQRVREASQHPFYAALAELTMTFVSLDVQRLVNR